MAARDSAVDAYLGPTVGTVAPKEDALIPPGRGDVDAAMEGPDAVLRDEPVEDDVARNAGLGSVVPWRAGKRPGGEPPGSAQVQAIRSRRKLTEATGKRSCVDGHLRPRGVEA